MVTRITLPLALVGLEALTRAREIIDDRYPLVAIGGINTENLGSVLQAGASSAAMISEFYRPESSISKQFASLLELTSGNNIVDNS
jgi:thiamine monophosphate synthase